ncbi:MAG: LptF/LptG family permease [Bacteroidota bacterium]
MKKLDWYILKKFLITFFYCVVLFNIISVAIDTSEKTDDFVKSGLTSKQIFLQYYLGFIPHITGLLFPLFVFIAVIFFTSRMASRSEVIAILSSGTTYLRYLRPYFIGGIFLSVLLWLGTAFVIPKANVLRTTFESKYIDNPFSTSGNNLNYYLKTDPNTYVGFRYYDTAFKSSSSFFLDYLKDDQLSYFIRSESMRWDTIARKWKLQTVNIRTIDGLKETVRVLPDTLVDLGFKPEELTKDEYLKDKLTTPALARFISREEGRASERVREFQLERYRRDARSASVLILTLIGAVIASRKIRGGSGVHLALGLLLAASYILTDRFSFVFSIKGNLHPLIASWLPNVLFGAIAIWLYKKAPK